jgi:hypothetical protein
MAWKQAQRQGEDRVTLWITLSDREFEDINKNHERSTSYTLEQSLVTFFRVYTLLKHHPQFGTSLGYTQNLWFMGLGYLGKKHIHI